MRRRAAVRRRHPPRHGVRRLGRARRRRRRRDRERSHRGPRGAWRRARPRGGGRVGSGRRARIHRHAEPLGDVAHRRRPIAERHPAGRDALGVRRELDGAAQRCDEAGSDGASGRHQVSDHVVDARRGARHARLARRFDERRVVRERVDDSRVRDWLRQSRADARRARAHARARPPRDGRRRHGADDGADLHARGVREDRRARRAGQGRGGVWRHVHFAHAQRGRPAARGDRRDADDCAAGAHPRGNLPPESGGAVELEEARRRDREDRGGAPRGPRDHGGHVHLHRRIDGPRRVDAAVGAGRRLRRLAAR